MCVYISFNFVFIYFFFVFFFHICLINNNSGRWPAWWACGLSGSLPLYYIHLLCLCINVLGENKDVCLLGSHSLSVSVTPLSRIKNVVFGPSSGSTGVR